MERLGQMHKSDAVAWKGPVPDSTLHYPRRVSRNSNSVIELFVFAFCRGYNFFRNKNSFCLVDTLPDRQNSHLLRYYSVIFVINVEA
jgi:hypothetical protein